MQYNKLSEMNEYVYCIDYNNYYTFNRSRLLITNHNLKTFSFNLYKSVFDTPLNIGDSIDCCIDAYCNYNSMDNKDIVNKILNYKNNYKNINYNNTKNKYKYLLYFMKNNNKIDNCKYGDMFNYSMSEITYNHKNYENAIKQQINWKNKYYQKNFKYGKIEIDLNKYDYYYALSCQICDCKLNKMDGNELSDVRTEFEFQIS